MDVWHVSRTGSYRAQNPTTKLLDRVIAEDDVIGIMTPEISARNLTLARRETSIDGMLRDNWQWAQRGEPSSPDKREQDIHTCYPSEGETLGIADAVIARRRESKTLDALEDLIIHLESVREDRKFVVLLTEGWVLHEPDSQLGRPLIAGAAGTGRRCRPADPSSVEREGARQMDSRAQGPLTACERERAIAARVNNHVRFEQIAQRANRANVSFYPVDARGMQVFDISRTASPPTTDAATLRRQLEALQVLASNTDGYAIIDPAGVDLAQQRMVADTGSYYLLGYYSTNTKLDGRLRKLTVRVKRPGAVVRTRPGYLAPTEAEAASARVDRLLNGAPAGHSDTPPELRRALESIIPSRAGAGVRLQAAASTAQIWITTELDAATAKSAEWLEGGRLHATLEHERGEAAPMVKEINLDPGQRSISWVERGSSALAPGRYLIRLALTAKGGSKLLQTTGEVNVPESDALVSRSGLAWRRGPATGLAYQPTADARYQRTERLRFEVPLLAADATTSARLLNRAGQTLPVAVAMTERSDDVLQVRMAVADLVLAPLAQGEYVLEVLAERNGTTQQVAYRFQIVP